MKHETVSTGCIGAALASCVSLALIQALITGFDLSLESRWLPHAACLICSALGVLAYSQKRGAWYVAGAAALAAGYLWRQGAFLEQLLRLLYRVSYLYNRAYHFGYLQLVEGAWNEGSADLPLAVLGAVAALSVCWSVCRGKGLLLPGLVICLPLATCFVVTDTVPSEGSLFALLLGFGMLLLTSCARSLNQNQGNRLAIYTVLPAAAALGLLFLSVPKEDYIDRSDQLWACLARFLPTQEQMTELSQINWTPPVNEREHVDLASLNGQPESALRVMTVQADVGGSLYLRGQDYDIYTGLGWESTPHRAEDFSGPGEDLGIVNVQTEDCLDRLYLPYYPHPGLSLVDGRLENTPLYTAYHFQRSGLPDDLDALLAQDPEPSQTRRPEYLSLPEHTQTFAAGLLEEILTDRSTATGQAHAIAAYLRQKAAYDRQTPRMPEGETDFAQWFLTQSDRGYCVHFATAAVVLLRAAGIEARYVSGYMVKVPSGGETAVTLSNAHAWAEYWEPRLNIWIPLEATPSADSAILTVPQQPAAPAVTEPSSAPPEVPSTAPAPTTSPSSPPQPTGNSPQPSPIVPPPSWVIWLLLALAGFVLLEGQRILRRAVRLHPRQMGNANAQAIARWQDVKRFARVLREDPPEKLEILTGKAKFSQHTLTDQELSAYDAYLQDAKNRVKQRNILIRLYCRYISAVL